MLLPVPTVYFRPSRHLSPGSNKEIFAGKTGRQGELITCIPEIAKGNKIEMRNKMFRIAA